MRQRNYNFHTRSIASALVALVMISYGIITSTRSTWENLDEFQMLSHTRDVQAELQRTLSAMQDLELGQRGFIIVGEESYLQPYHASLEVLDRHLEAVAGKTADRPEQQQRIGQLTEAARLKKDYLAKTIEIRRTLGEDEANRVTASGEGKRLMDRFREILGEMMAVEEALVEKRRSRLVSELKRTNLVVGLTGGIAILSGAVGVGLLFLYLRNQQRLDKARSDKDKAVQSDHAKSEFLAMMSHEIRTPMNAILGFGELLDDSLETSEQKHYAKAILSSGNSLLVLINDILDLSKIEASKLELHPEPVEVRGFMGNLETLFSFRASEKGLEYVVEVEPSVPAVLSFDALRLRQILVNLIGNALKFTREGSVKVRVKAVERAEDERVWLVFSVTDTGIGIGKGHQEEIFKPFYQVDSRNSRDFQGTGLGLNISERLAKVMEGKIAVESEPGRGSVFTLEIPALRSRQRVLFEPDSRTVVDFNRLAPSKILVADDVALNRELIRGYLHGSHHEVYEAENGEQAVVLCKKYRPDIALLDIRMPVMDGREARLRLKSMEETKDIPLLAVSASSLMNSQAELKSLFDGFAEKPLNRNRLFTELARFIPAAEPQEGKPEGKGDAITDPPDDRRVEDREGLSNELSKMRASPWPELVKLVPAQATIAFASRLADLAKRHRADGLEAYADRLRKSVEVFDLHSAGRLLESFPELVNQYSTDRHA